MPVLIAPRTQWQYVLELYRQTDDDDEAEQIATARVKPDWDPAVECARFELLRRHPAQTVQLGAEETHVEPVWHERLDEPYVQSLRAIATANDGTGREASSDIPTAFLSKLAEAAAVKLVAEGALSDGEKFRYLVTAYPRDEENTPAAPAPFVIEAIAQTLELDDHLLDDFLKRSRPYGPVDDDELPVFIPEFVLDEGKTHLDQAGAVETGGILIGRMHRDSRRGIVFLEVTAQIPARHTDQTLASVTFTPDTWSDVDAAVALRDLGEIHLGWWHTHPARQWCKDCPIESRKVCKRSGEFFSSDDVALHRTIFPRAYSVALVISDSYADGLTWPMFGWKQGTVQHRGFHVLKNER